MKKVSIQTAAVFHYCDASSESGAKQKNSAATPKRARACLRRVHDCKVSEKGDRAAADRYLGARVRLGEEGTPDGQEVPRVCEGREGGEVRRGEEGQN